MNDVFRDMLNWFVIINQDDILIYSRTYQEHVHHVKLVFRHLLDHGLYVTAKKFEFHKSKLSFLCYQIGPLGIRQESV